MSIVGVGTARCQRCYKGAGTVKVVIADSELNEANVLLLQRVYECIEQERPIGVTDLAVVSAKIVPINISAKISGAIDVDAFSTGVTNYFKKMVRQTLFTYENAGSYETFTGDTYVSIAQINSYLIAEGGADDIHDLTLNGAATDVQLNIDEIPKLGDLDFYL